MNAIKDCEVSNWTNPDEVPTGGYVKGTGLNIQWQEGALKEPDGQRKEPNGAFVETVISACVQRLEFFQQSKFKCRENALAITKLEEALHWLNWRTQGRELRQVEGTHKV
jgi:hypothetical protein